MLFKDLVKINELMRSEVDRQTIVRKRLLTDDGGAPVVGSGVTSNAVVNLFGATEAAPNADEPPVKVQMATAGQTIGGGVNQRLELILGDRSSQAN